MVRSKSNTDDRGSNQKSRPARRNQKVRCKRWWSDKSSKGDEESRDKDVKRQRVEKRE